MSLHIVVCAKQVLDPEAPPSALRVDTAARRVVPTGNVPLVVNGFDEQATEAALQIKDRQEARVTVLSAGAGFVMDAARKPLAMGADDLALLQDKALQDVSDSFVTATALAAAIRKLGKPDLVLCGRQASDWDNAQAPLILAEMLGLPCVTLARGVEVQGARVRVRRVMPEGYQDVEAPLPAVVTVSNEIGQPRYPTLRGIMGAARKPTVTWSLADMGVDAASLRPRVELLDLFQPERQSKCEMIEGETGADKGRRLALRLREAGLI